MRTGHSDRSGRPQDSFLSGYRKKVVHKGKNFSSNNLSKASKIGSAFQIMLAGRPTIMPRCFN